MKPGRKGELEKGKGEKGKKRDPAHEREGKGGLRIPRRS